MCNIFLNMCIVGLVETGPAVYNLQTIDSNHDIQSYVVLQSRSCPALGIFDWNRSGSPELSRAKLP